MLLGAYYINEAFQSLMVNAAEPVLNTQQFYNKAAF